MKQYVTVISAIMMLILASCEDRTGYYSHEQQEIIAKLTDKDWKQVYEHQPDFDPTVYDGEGMVYRFNSDGTGSCKWASWSDGTITGEPEYFRWTFTTDNFAVIYITKLNRYWLIDKLTADNIWVYDSYQDPVMYPNSYEVFCKFTVQ